MQFPSCRDKEHWRIASPNREFDFTPCFEEGIILTLLLATLTISSAWKSWYLLTRQQAKLERSRRSHLLLNAKLTILALATTASWVNVFLIFLAKVVVPVSTPYILEPIALASSILLTFCSHTRTKRASTILLIFWPCYILVIAIWTRTMIDVRYHSWLVLYIKWTTAVLGCLSYTLEIIGPKVGPMAVEKAENENPITLANIYSIWTFSWMTPLMRKGASQILTAEDMPPLQAHDEARELGDNLKGALQKHTLWKALFITYGGPYAVAALLKVTQDLLAFSQPQLLRLLLNFISLYQSAKSHDDRPSKYQGFGIVFLMFISSSIQTISLNQYFQRTFETGMRVRAGLITTIYDKTLRLSNDERSRASGDIVNLMSVDATRLQGLCSSGLMSISAPLQITLAFISLYSLLGWASFVGIAIMLLSIPTNTLVAQMSRRVQEEQMKVRDKRTRLMSEVLANIRSIKFYAWEYTFMRRILEVRNNQEVILLKRFCFIVAGSIALWGGIPLLASFGSFAVAAYFSSTPLTPDVIFPSISLFMLLQFPLGMIGQITSSIIEAMVSVKRLTEFLNADELQRDARRVIETPSPRDGDVTLSIRNGDFSWSNKTTELALEGIELVVKKGELVGIFGKVGAGKSNLISAIIGDMTRTKGELEIFGTVAYASQDPWIMSATVRQNILFFHEYDETFYNLVVEGCALEPDLAVLPDGDLTEVGEKGLTLSGGQRARIALARAVYARTDLVLLDDCLAAVDSHVARHVFDKIIGPSGLLSTKARILVNNSITFVRQMNSILFIQKGVVIEQGSFQQLFENRNGEFSKLIASHGNTHTESDASTPTNTSGTITPNVASPISPDLTPDAIEKLKRRQSFGRARLAPITARGISTGLTKEHKEEGGVKIEVYKQYIQAASKIGCTLFVIVTVLQQVASVFGNLTLRYWGEHNLEGKGGDISKYLLIYGAFSLSNILLGMASTMLLWMFCSLRSSRRLHDAMLNALFAAPLSFFETTPTGRILNLFSREIYVLDMYIAHLIRDLLYTLAVCVCTTCVIGINFPPFLLSVVPLGWFYTRVMKYYLATSRELQRLSAVSRSPIVSWFSDSISGLSTIRAFSMQNAFRETNARCINQNQMCALPGIAANRWLAIRLEFVGVMVISTVGLLAMFTLITTGIDAGLVGLVLSYALDTTSSLNWFVRSASSVEQNIVSVERVLHQTQVAPEAPKEIPDAKPPGEWPLQGKIEFRGYSTRYRPELELVLKDISFVIRPNEKLGVCGRTGAGKSSLLLALFRIIEPASGTIYIDDVDISKIGLQDLRSTLSIVPQSPDLFEGTLRENIDPVGEYSDSDIWFALGHVHLKEYVEGLEEKLDTSVREGGSSLSSGQRQLLCFARALLKKSKILVLDEATSTVDLDTDKAIQEIVQGPAFTNVTILTIAHRLNTILNSDRVLVMDAGTVAELDTPGNLLEDPTSLFYSLSKEAGLTSNTAQGQPLKG